MLSVHMIILFFITNAPGKYVFLPKAFSSYAYACGQGLELTLGCPSLPYLRTKDEAVKLAMEKRSSLF